eukprot:gene9024-6481_t
MIDQSEDDWDDATIMKVFHDSIKRHKTGRNTTTNATDEKPIQVPPIPSSSSSKRKRALEDGEVVEDSDGGKGHGPTESKRAKPLDNPPTGEEQTEDSQRYDYRQFSSNYSGFGPSLATSDLKGMLDEAQQTMLMAWYQSG